MTDRDVDEWLASREYIPCPQCGEPRIDSEFAEGVCGECRELNQFQLDRWNFEFDRWQALTDRQRADEIRRAAG